MVSMKKSILYLLATQLILASAVYAQESESVSAGATRGHCKRKNKTINGNLWVKGDLRIGGKITTRCDIDASMQLLYNAFLAVDAGFNNAGGLTPTQIVALGYFGPLTSTSAFGPFTPDVCGHTDHTNQPGAFQAIGAEQSAFLQVQFEGGLLADPNFPYANLAGAPKIFHDFPIVTAVINNELVNVIATADVRYPGVNGPLVARISSLAQYQLRCDRNGNPMIPVIVWIDFYISYFDCEQ